MNLSVGCLTLHESTVKKEYHKIPKLQPQFSPHDPINQKILKLLRIICRLCRDVGYCYAFNSYFEKKVGVSERTIKRYLRKMEKAGYIISYYSRKRAYWRHIHLTDLGEEFWYQLGPNTTSYINNNNTKERLEGKIQEISSDPLLNSSVPGFTSVKIKKLENEIQKFEEVDGELRLEITAMWKENGDYSTICKLEERKSNLSRVLDKKRQSLVNLKGKEWEEFLLSKYHGFDKYVVKFYLLCRRKNLDFTRLFLEGYFSITKGSLQKVKATGEKMSFHQGFNIVMSKIRKNEWRSPTGFNKKYI